MKINFTKILVIFAIFLYSTPTNLAFAVTTASSSATPSITKSDRDKIADLKERIATKVAELQQIQKYAVTGTVKTTSIASLVVETKTKDLKIELTDDIKVIQYIKNKRTVLKSEDIKKSDYITIFGDYDSTLDIVKAKVILISAPADERFTGVISNIDTDKYIISVTTFKNTQIDVDFEKYTKAFNWLNGKIEKSGFSSLSKNNIVSISGNINKNKRISAVKILQITTTDNSEKSVESSISGTLNN